MKVWDIKRTVFSVGDFISWARSSELELSPSFQRRPVWRKNAKSYFIDTIARGLPVPIIFLRERTDIEKMSTVREVVDGQQRLRTLISFIDKSLVPDFTDEDDFTVLRKHNDSIYGKGFSDLSGEVKHQILSYQMSVHVLPSETDDADVLKIFSRMNATGTKLKNQELRNAEFQGEFFHTVYDASLEQLDRWRRWGVFTEYNIARMDDCEMTSELFIFMMNGVTGGTKSIIDRYYKDFDDEYKNKNIIKRRFSKVFDELDNNIGDKLKSSPFSRKTLFYILFSVYYDLMYGVNSSLTKKSAKHVSKNSTRAILNAGKKISDGTATRGAIEAAARRTTHPSSRSILFRYVRGKAN